MDTGLAGRRAAVAAASKGLGFASARALAAEGARVAICGRSRERIEGAAARIGAGAVPLVADVSNPDGARQFVIDARDALGGLDVLVTNAGGPPPGNFETTPFENYTPALALNLLSVVAITSISVRQPMPNLILSNTARAGATGFLKTLAREVARDGVTVNSVQPGSHATDRLLGLYGDGAKAAEGVPTGELGRPEDFGAVVTFLCSDSARFITGAAIPVDGGAYGGLL